MTDASRATLCDRTQLALVDGTPGATLGGELAAHVDDCDECRFVAHASRRLRSAAGTPSAAPGSVAFIDAMLADLHGAGEPLLGRYRLERRLGGGGQGVVYRARDLDGDEEVAIKVVRSDGDGATADVAAAEVANAHRIRHPAVCRVYHSERHGRLRVIVMELLDGRTLADRLPMAPRDALRVFHEIAAAVHAGHEAGVLHLDLKPENVLYHGDGSPVVTDFGLSMRAGPDGSTRATGGTAAYMAPEAQRGEPVDRRADVYALGVLLERMVADRPRWLRRAVARATARDPAERPATALALARAVDVPSRRRRLARRVAIIALAIVAVALAAFFVVPPPTGGRAGWRGDLWGPDRIPRDAWNVAVNRHGSGLPAARADGPGFACARNPAELIDGVAQYTDWEHGFAFAGRTAVCIARSMLPYCGERRADARTCDAGGEPGQIDPASDCSERAITIELDRAYRISAVRSWYHGGPMVPGALRVQVDDGGGEFRDVFVTRENRSGMDPTWYPGGAGGAVPLTVELAPVTARRVRLVVDPCSTLDLEHPENPGNVVWIYEIEVFARLGRFDAWRRWLAAR